MKEDILHQKSSAHHKNPVLKPSQSARNKAMSKIKMSKGIDGVATEYANESQEELFCLCWQPNDPAKPMVLCKQCKCWFHLSCVNLNYFAEDDDYISPLCDAHMQECIDNTNKDLTGSNTSHESFFCN